MFKINKKLVLASTFLSLVAASQAFAATNGLNVTTASRPGLVNNTISEVMINITNYVLGFITVIAVLMLIWGGIRYLTAAGDEAMVESAKHTITYAIIGLIIVAVAYAVVVVVVNTIAGGSF